MERQQLPAVAGVYLFKDSHGTILYVGKAKNLKHRVASYFLQNNLKSQAIVSASHAVEHIATKNEVEALLLEAQLIRTYQPKFNVLLKTGQPYVYLVFTKSKLPQLSMVRTKKGSGSYYGPFLEKGHARRVYNFLIKTFNLHICKTRMPNGCLHYHMGACAGSCRDDFDKEAYIARLKLAEQSLKKGHKTFLAWLEAQIKKHNKALAFETSKELHGYHQSFTRVFEAMDTKFSTQERSLSYKHIWVAIDQTLILFSEKNNVTTKKGTFLDRKDFLRYYHTHDCPYTILTNFVPTEDPRNIERFLQAWHNKSYPVKLWCSPSGQSPPQGHNPPRRHSPLQGHLKNLLDLALVHAQQEHKRTGSLGGALKRLLKLPYEPKTIDCFDVSHKQGLHMVGSCVRFTNGTPDKANFRHFRIKQVTTQDDYKSLQEIVQRRYKDQNVPDLILIDGGKGQLNAVRDLVDTECAALAKKEEKIYSTRIPEGKNISVHTIAGQLLIRIRDYAHHFAISYHKKACRLDRK